MSKRQKLAHQQKLERKYMNPTQPTPSPAEQAAFEKAMETEHGMIFKKKELVAIFNILTNIQLKFGDYAVIAPIIEKLHPIVAVDSNIPQEDSLIGTK